MGIARGSNQELLEDYKDYIKHHDIKEWATANKGRFDRLRAFAKEHSDVEDYMPFFDRWSDEEMANCALCLCHMVDKAMCSFIEKKDRDFVEQGGIRERMTAARLDQRASQKEIIERQQEEIERLRAEVASLRRELAAIKVGRGGDSGGSGTPGISGEPRISG